MTADYCDFCRALGAGIIVNTGPYPPYYYCSNACLVEAARLRSLEHGLRAIGAAMDTRVTPPAAFNRPAGVTFGLRVAGSDVAS